MIRPEKRNALLVAAITGLSATLWLGPGSAQAQYLQQNGHLNDANHQVGSGGANYPTRNGQINQNTLNTDIITGQVGGLGYFHGNTNREINPNTFDGNAQTGASDRLNMIVGRTVGAGGTQYQAPQGATPQPFYTTQTFVGTPPPGVALTTTGANSQYLVPTPQIDPTLPNADTQLDPGNNIYTNPASNNLPTLDTLDVMGGQLDPSGAASGLSMNPLYGVRQLQGDNPDSFYLAKYGTARASETSQGDQDQIQKMRDELNGIVVPLKPADQTPGAPVKPAPGADQLNQGALPNPAAPKTDSSASPAQLNSGLLNSNVGNQQFSGTLNSGQGMQDKLLIPPAEQSSQLKLLEQKYAAQKGILNPVDATKQFNEMKRVNEKFPGDANAKSSGPTGIDPAMVNGGGPVDKDHPAPAPQPILTGPVAGNDDKPVIITSLADGIRAKGLADTMRSAEEKLRQGKFSEAVAAYETAQRVAQNNPFVYLGRFFAELGASSYGRADKDLLRAVLIEPAVLSGKYDLNGFLGQNRVDFIKQELTGISTTEPGARAFVLLAFIAHNTGDDAAAAKDLSEAAARNEAATRGGYGGLIEEMRTNWKIKAPASSVQAPVQAPVPAK